MDLNESKAHKKLFGIHDAHRENRNYEITTQRTLKQPEPEPKHSSLSSLIMSFRDQNKNNGSYDNNSTTSSCNNLDFSRSKASLIQFQTINEFIPETKEKQTNGRFTVVSVGVDENNRPKDDKTIKREFEKSLKTLKLSKSISPSPSPTSSLKNKVKKERDTNNESPFSYYNKFESMTINNGNFNSKQPPSSPKTSSSTSTIGTNVNESDSSSI
jgi:hypothetical protein